MIYYKTANAENIVSISGKDIERMEPKEDLIIHQAVEIKPDPKQENGIPKFAPRNAEFFRTAEIKEPEPIIEDILYCGLALFGAPNKFGKSYTVLKLCCDVASGHPFMGKKIIKAGKVLLLDLEGNEARTKKRLAKIGYAEMPENLLIQYRKNVRTIDDGFFQQLQTWLKDEPETVLIVIDMWKNVKGAVKIKEDDYSAVNRMLTPVQALAIENNVSIMTTLHTRKQVSGLSIDDPFNEIIGSTAYFGTADCGWMLLGRRDEDRKRFFVLCRDNDEGQQEYEVEFKDFKYTIIGTREEVEKEDERRNYENNPVVFTLKKLIEKDSVWTGTMTDLNRELVIHTGESKSPKSLNTVLQKLAFPLQKYDNIRIVFPDRNGGKKGRQYKIYKPTPKQIYFTDQAPELEPDI